MIRLIKRYGSRKLYDTEESRYVSLEELADWIREGQEIRVVDNKTQEEVTAQTLTQIISEEGRKGRTLLPNELLHELIRLGEQAVSSGVEHLQTKVDGLVQASLDRIGPVRRAREEMSRLRERLELLEGSLAELDHDRRSAQGSSPDSNQSSPTAQTSKPASKAASKPAPKPASKATPKAAPKAASRSASKASTSASRTSKAARTSTTGSTTTSAGSTTPTGEPDA